MERKQKDKLKKILNKNLGLRRRAKLILELEEFITNRNLSFKELIKALRDFLKDGNGQYAVITEQIIDQIARDLQNALYKAESRNEKQ